MSIPRCVDTRHVALIKTAAEDPQVNRIFVNTAIKKALCRDDGNDRAWLRKVQPCLGHDWHFHVRLKCPPDSSECETQPARDAGTVAPARKCIAGPRRRYPTKRLRPRGQGPKAFRLLASRC
jgi:penicillin-insensitive murein DD-endopeptidase